jgi:hypothetical protein
MIFFYGNKVTDVTGGIIFISTFKQVPMLGIMAKRPMSPDPFINFVHNSADLIDIRGQIYFLTCSENRYDTFFCYM